MFIKVASSPRLLGIGMPSPILWSHLLKVQRMVLLSSLLWWEQGTNTLIIGPDEWLSFRRFISKLSWSWSTLHIPQLHFFLTSAAWVWSGENRPHQNFYLNRIGVCTRYNKWINPNPKVPTYYTNSIFFWSLIDSNTHSFIYSANMTWTSVECFLCLHIEANIGFKRDGDIW